MAPLAGIAAAPFILQKLGFLGPSRDPVRYRQWFEDNPDWLSKGKEGAGAGYLSSLGIDLNTLGQDAARGLADFNTKTGANPNSQGSGGETFQGSLTNNNVVTESRNPTPPANSRVNPNQWIMDLFGRRNELQSRLESMGWDDDRQDSPETRADRREVGDLRSQITRIQNKAPKPKNFGKPRTISTYNPSQNKWVDNSHRIKETAPDTRTRSQKDIDWIRSGKGDWGNVSQSHRDAEIRNRYGV